MPARSSGRCCSGRQKSWPSIVSRSTSIRRCRCCGSITCCSSKRCSTCSTTPPNTHRRTLWWASRRAGKAPPSCSASRTRERVFRSPISSASSTNSIAFMRRTGSAPAPGSASLSAAASSRRWAAPSPPAIAMAGAPSSPSRFSSPKARIRRGTAHMVREACVLIVDDEPPIRRFLRTSLAAQGYRLVEAATGAEALAAVAHDKPDIVILDLGLPDRNGLDLIATIRTAIRHRFQAKGEPPVFVAGELTVDLVRRLVKRSSAELKLSPKEYELLKVLVENAGRVLTHRQILAQVWGAAHTEDTQYLRVFVRSLRQKIERDPAQPVLIRTEPGVGYRLQSADIEKVGPASDSP